MNCSKIVHYLEISDCPGQGFLKAKGEYYLSKSPWIYLFTYTVFTSSCRLSRQIFIDPKPWE